MAFWHDNRGLDDFVRTTDRTLNVLVIVLLAAFALGSGAYYYYGQMNPRAAQTSSSGSVTVSPPSGQR